MELSIKIQTQITILKLIKLEQKKKKKSKANPSEPRWEEDIVVLLECSGVDVVLEKKGEEKKKEK